MVTALAHVRSGPKYKEKTSPLREEEVKLKVTKIHFIHMLWLAPTRGPIHVHYTLDSTQLCHM